MCSSHIPLTLVLIISSASSHQVLRMNGASSISTLPHYEAPEHAGIDLLVGAQTSCKHQVSATSCLPVRWKKEISITSSYLKMASDAQAHYRNVNTKAHPMLP